jgi:hypothetical protein
MTRVQKIHFLWLPLGEKRALENYIGYGFKFLCYLDSSQVRSMYYIVSSMKV